MTVSKIDESEFYVVDFDRTLVDSDKLFEVFVEIADRYVAISPDQVNKAAEDVKQKGDSFDTAGYVRDHLREEGRLDDWEKLEKQFIHESRSLNYLLPGASELLEWLALNGKHYGILTYGNPLWQHLKLTASGFNHVRHIIIEKKEKGRLIASWQKSDGTFRLPDEFGRYSASHIVMIDDKAVSFEGFPSQPSCGYWVCDPENALPSQLGSVQENITRVSNLQSVINSL